MPKYTVDWVGTAALGVMEDGKPKYAFALDKGEAIPAQFTTGDEVQLIRYPARSEDSIEQLNSSSFEIVHISSGIRIEITHRCYEHIFRF